jgi:predicted CopG family antitoxin
MQKKPTITIDENIYNNLYAEIGPRKISRFIEKLLRPYVIKSNLEKSYIEMSKDTKRENEALEWIEGVLDGDYN